MLPKPQLAPFSSPPVRHSLKARNPSTAARNSGATFGNPPASRSSNPKSKGTAHNRPIADRPAAAKLASEYAGLVGQRLLQQSELRSSVVLSEAKPHDSVQDQDQELNVKLCDETNKEVAELSLRVRRQPEGTNGFPLRFIKQGENEEVLRRYFETVTGCEEDQGNLVGPPTPATIEQTFQPYYMPPLPHPITIAFTDSPVMMVRGKANNPVPQSKSVSLARLLLSQHCCPELEDAKGPVKEKRFEAPCGPGKQANLLETMSISGLEVRSKVSRQAQRKHNGKKRANKNDNSGLKELDPTVKEKFISELAGPGLLRLDTLEVLENEQGTIVIRPKKPISTSKKTPIQKGATVDLRAKARPKASPAKFAIKKQKLRTPKSNADLRIDINAGSVASVRKKPAIISASPSCPGQNCIIAHVFIVEH